MAAWFPVEHLDRSAYGWWAVGIFLLTVCAGAMAVLSAQLLWSAMDFGTFGIFANHQDPPVSASESGDSGSTEIHDTNAPAEPVDENRHDVGNRPGAGGPGEVDELWNDLDALHSEVAHLRSSIASTADEIEQIAADVDKHIAAHDRQEKDDTNNNRSASALQKQISGLEDELQRELDNVSKEVATQRDSLNTRIDDARQDATSRTTLLTTIVSIAILAQAMTVLGWGMKQLATRRSGKPIDPPEDQRSTEVEASETRAVDPTVEQSEVIDLTDGDEQQSKDGGDNTAHR